MTVDEAVMMASLVRALARTCYAEALREEAVQYVRPELLRAAKWRAARYGLDADLIDVEAGRATPARELVEKFLNFLRPMLEEQGEWEETSALVQEIMERGGGAARQREVYARNGKFEEVVDFIVAETRKGIV
jgi:carboxylate-amine ligase